MTTTVHPAAPRPADAAAQPGRERPRPSGPGRLVKLDLLVAALALALILAVTAIDHLAHGDVAAVAGLLLG